MLLTVMPISLQAYVKQADAFEDDLMEWLSGTYIRLSGRPAVTASTALVNALLLAGVREAG